MCKDMQLISWRIICCKFLTLFRRQFSILCIQNYRDVLEEYNADDIYYNNKGIAETKNYNDKIFAMYFLIILHPVQ